MHRLMKKPMLKHAVAIVAVGALAGGLTGCNASAEPSGGAASDAGPSLILVTPEPAGANEFLQFSISGIKEAANAIGGAARIFESQDISRVSQQMEAAVAAQPDLIVAVGFEFADSIGALAPANPEQNFLFVDACIEAELPNVSCAVFREHEAVFLAGAEAGLLTESNKVGAVVALDTPQIRRFSDPFGAGAQYTNKEADFTPLYVGGQNPFNDPGRAKEQALSLANDGVDIMIAASAGGNSGVFDAARSAGFLAFGVDTNQCPTAPGSIVDNVLKDVDVVIVASVKAVFDGKTSGVDSYGLAEGAVSLTSMSDEVANSECMIAEHPDVITELNAIRDQIIGGEINVDDPADA